MVQGARVFEFRDYLPQQGVGSWGLELRGISLKNFSSLRTFYNMME